jgi:hypothetical protein
MCLGKPWVTGIILKNWPWFFYAFGLFGNSGAQKLFFLFFLAHLACQCLHTMGSFGQVLSFFNSKRKPKMFPKHYKNILKSVLIIGALVSFPAWLSQLIPMQLVHLSLVSLFLWSRLHFTGIPCDQRAISNGLLWRKQLLPYDSQDIKKSPLNPAPFLCYFLPVVLKIVMSPCYLMYACSSCFQMPLSPISPPHCC